MNLLFFKKIFKEIAKLLILPEKIEFFFQVKNFGSEELDRSVWFQLARAINIIILMVVLLG